MQAKPCRESRVIKTNRVFPNDVNDHNTLFGGKPMSDAEDLRSADRRIAFLTFVAIDDAGLPAQVPPVLPESDEELQLNRFGDERAETRRAHRQQSQKMAEYLTTSRPW
ncbi:hypothetical protein EV641_12024 [Rhodococcus sp. SMB37]|uniref:hypothetical protein n=1 Tax=Rhodococcus sp. SMB37 TaxID=2512213 RepID=UPI00104FCAEC|nr:hypothetical protein [Rhodococcus sp. SMB37]TCN46730.1 hypothetical protein EV641_12024 [Rhodococcus sp. SMB37]